MTRRADSTYAGASGTNVDPEELHKLGSGYVLQPKQDGIFGLVSTDKTGRVSNIVTRTGEILGANLMAEFRGVRWAPNSLIVAEVELWTEASNRIAETRGYRMIHAFDAHQVGGVDLSSEPYRVRRDALMRAESQLVNDDVDRPWNEDDEGDAHDVKTGRYQAKVPKGWRRVSVVPQLPVGAASEAWAAWVDGGTCGPCEGLVAVALEAKLGAKRSKLKSKRTSTIDATVTAMSDRAVSLYWLAGQRTITVSRPKTIAFKVGAVVELVHEGFHESGEPRFCRALRLRPDLLPSRPKSAHKFVSFADAW